MSQPGQGRITVDSDRNHHRDIDPASHARLMGQEVSRMASGANHITAMKQWSCVGEFGRGSVFEKVTNLFGPMRGGRDSAWPSAQGKVFPAPAGRSSVRWGRQLVVVVQAFKAAWLSACAPLIAAHEDGAGRRFACAIQTHVYLLR